MRFNVRWSSFVDSSAATSRAVQSTRSKVVGNLLAAGLIAAVALFVLAEPGWQFMISRRSRVGTTLGAMSLTPLLDGGPGTLFAADTITFVIFLDAGCAACRRNAKTYVQFADWIARQGSSVRLVLCNQSEANAQFARLAGGSVHFSATTNEAYRADGILATPTTVLVDRGRTIVARWIGELPGRDVAMGAISSFAGAPR